MTERAGIREHLPQPIRRHRAVATRHHQDRAACLGHQRGPRHGVERGGGGVDRGGSANPVVSLPTDALIAELADGGAKKDGVLFALGGALRAFPNEILVQGQGVGIDDAERWGKLLLLTQMSAAAIEQAGVSGPIPARTELAPGNAASMQVTVVITARANGTH